MSGIVSTDHHKIHSEEPKHCILQHLQHHPGHDVTIICRDGSLMTHQLVLACVSPMLRTEMSLLGSSDDMLTISMPDLTKEHLTDFLASLYQCKDLASNQCPTVLLSHHNGLLIQSKFNQDFHICNNL